MQKITMATGITGPEICAVMTTRIMNVFPKFTVMNRGILKNGKK